MGQYSRIRYLKSFADDDTMHPVIRQCLANAQALRLAFHQHAKLEDAPPHVAECIRLQQRMLENLLAAVDFMARPEISQSVLPTTTEEVAILDGIGPPPIGPGDLTAVEFDELCETIRHYVPDRDFSDDSRRITDLNERFALNRCDGLTMGELRDYVCLVNRLAWSLPDDDRQGARLLLLVELLRLGLPGQPNAAINDARRIILKLTNNDGAQ